MLPTITLSWFLDLLIGTPQLNRAHGPNLDAIRSLFDGESNNLNWAFGVITATMTALAAAIVAALLAALNTTSRTVATEQGNVNTTEFESRSGDVGTHEIVLAVLLVLVILGTIGALV